LRYFKGTNFRRDKISRISRFLPKSAKLSPREILRNRLSAKLNPREIFQNHLSAKLNPRENLLNSLSAKLRFKNLVRPRLVWPIWYHKDTFGFGFVKTDILQCFRNTVTSKYIGFSCHSVLSAHSLDSRSASRRLCGCYPIIFLNGPGPNIRDIIHWNCFDTAHLIDACNSSVLADVLSTLSRI